MTNTKTSTVQTFTIPRDGLNAAKIGSYAGDALEVLAAVCDFSAYEECRENSFDYFSESITQGLKEYRWEDALLDALNDAPDIAVQAMLLEQAGEDAQEYAPILAAYSGQPLKLGAFIALEYPAVWERMIDAWRDNQTNIAHECLGGYADRPGLYPPLAKTLDDCMDTLEDDLMRDYLRGDGGRNHNGLEYEAAKRYGLDSVTYNPKDGTITIEYDPASEELQEKISAFSEALDDAGLDSYDAKDAEAREKVAAAFDWPAEILAAIERAGVAYIEREKRKNEERRAEREKTEAYKKDRRKEAEAKRIAKLRAMTK